MLNRPYARLVSALDGFLSTWSQANTTFGRGTPSEGSRFDHSDGLHRLQNHLGSAAPTSTWTGAASTSYAATTGRTERVLGSLADLDQRLGTEIDNSAAVVTAGRRDLHAIRTMVVDAAATVASARLLWPRIIRGASDILDVIGRSHGDLTAIADRIRGLGSQYDDLGSSPRRP